MNRKCWHCEPSLAQLSLWSTISIYLITNCIIFCLWFGYWLYSTNLYFFYFVKNGLKLCLAFYFRSLDFSTLWTFGMIYSALRYDRSNFDLIAKNLKKYQSFFYPYSALLFSAKHLVFWTIDLFVSAIFKFSFLTFGLLL